MAEEQTTSGGLAELAIRLAVQIALESKQKALRRKGRPFSERANRQWQKIKLRGEVLAILSKAFAFARWLVPENDAEERLQIVVETLDKEWDSVRRSAGRPKHRVGLINRTAAATKKAVGRPRAHPKEELERLVAFGEGFRAKRYLSEYPLSGYRAFYNRVGAVPKAEIRSELNRIVADAKIVLEYLNWHSQSQSSLPRDPDALKKLLQKARRTTEFRFQPPKAGAVIR